MSKKLLITGGCGFIGHHTIEYIMNNTDWEVFTVDRLTYAGNLNFLALLPRWYEYKDRVHFVYHDIRSPFSETVRNMMPSHFDYLIHMAAETHVDRSITDPEPFVMTNVLGTLNVLEFAKSIKTLDKMIMVSTDEVYGPAIGGYLHLEGEPHKPSNPYSASKSGAEALSYAYWNTYGLPVVITNTMNNFGERQNKEKFVPKTVSAIMNGTPVILHCKKDENGNILDISSRCWLHAKDHASGLLFVLKNGQPGDRYNIVGDWADVEMIADIIGETLGLNVNKNYVDFHSFRPGHDMHYGLSGVKLATMGWTPKPMFDSLKSTIGWIAEHPEWIR